MIGKDYIIVPYIMWNTEVNEYWMTIYNEGLLWDRFCDVNDPTVADIKKIIGNDYYFFIAGDKYLAEFCLQPIGGLAYKIHFSFLPSVNGIKKVRIGKEVINFLINDYKNGLGASCISCLIGQTPVSNKQAIRFNKLIGLKKLITLPKSMIYKGNIVDSNVYIIGG